MSYYIAQGYCVPALYDEYLAQSGIKGMKWGVRRYQNEDGTLTEAGKKRYSKGPYQKSFGLFETGLLSDKATSRLGAYADQRVKTRGALQAINDEKNSLTKSKIIRGAETAAIAAGSAFALANGSLEVAAIGGAATVGKHFVNKYLNAKQTKYMNRNIDALKLASQAYGVKR